jgi:hypothetical protein
MLSVLVSFADGRLVRFWLTSVADMVLGDWDESLVVPQVNRDEQKKKKGYLFVYIYLRRPQAEAAGRAACARYRVQEGS